MLLPPKGRDWDQARGLGMYGERLGQLCMALGSQTRCIERLCWSQARGTRRVRVVGLWSQTPNMPYAHVSGQMGMRSLWQGQEGAVGEIRYVGKGCGEGWLRGAFAVSIL